MATRVLHQAAQTALGCLTYTLLLSGLGVSRSDRVCEKLHSDQQTVYAIGTLHNRVVLITSGGQLYDLPSSALQSSAHRLYLFGDVALQERWPLLASKWLKTTAPVAVLSDQQDDFLLTLTTTTNGTADILTLLTYNLNNGEVKSTAATQVPTYSCFISSSEPLVFYGITLDTDKRFRVDICKLTDSDLIVQELGYLCIDQNRISLLQLGEQPGEGVSCLDTVALHNSFMDDHRIYLFVDSELYIFDRSLISTHEWIKLDKLLFKDFFVCGHKTSTDAVMVWFARAWFGNLALLLCFLYSLILYAHCIKPRHRTKSALSTSSVQFNELN